MAIQTDVLILGSGVTGLTTAIKLAEVRPDISITVLAKTMESETNTSYAQGGVAAVWDLTVDSFEKHIADTLDAGDGLCDEEIVRMVITEGPDRVRDLISWGANFDRSKSNGEQYDLGREGGHTVNRILHYKDITGREIERTLIEKAATFSNIKVHEHFFAVDLITQHHLGKTVTRVTPDTECFGAYVLDRKTSEIITFLAKSVVIATGGAGQVYRSTTNPVVATGDGVAMMYRANGRVENMEFVQFHPTALYNESGDNPDFLISEAVRGFGAVLKTADGEPFMQKYDERLSLAPRDIVARAIDNEMKIRGEEFVYLDCRELVKEDFIAHFPTIYNKCMSLGIDPMEQMIPVVPACHYMCGGIQVDKNGLSSIKRVLAGGECTASGLHGANRLASNSLLEGLVYGDRIAAYLREHLDQFKIQDGVPDWNAKGTNDPKEMVLITQSRKELRDIISYYVGIVRSNIRLKRAADRNFLLYNETEALYNTTTISPQLLELRNLITIGYLIIRSASMRHESRGLHLTTDYPEHFDFIDKSIL